MMCGLFHYGLRAMDADTTLNFYTRVLGMVLDESRPNLPISGFWLRAALPGSPPSIHVFTGDDARVELSDATSPTGSAAVHHLSLYCRDYGTVRRKLAEYGLPWQGASTPNGKQWVIFVYDPNGVMLELSFEASVEDDPAPEVPAENAYVPSAPFGAFDPADYAIFAH
jgi:catechol 2,3-dioxygenase-like lactoylglutathione lyase family enzyme